MCHESWCGRGYVDPTGGRTSLERRRVGRSRGKRRRDKVIAVRILQSGLLGGRWSGRGHIMRSGRRIHSGEVGTAANRQS